MPAPIYNDKTLQLTIHGKVQGVFFRDSMRHEAMQKQINGWVKNNPDGTVTAMLQGKAEAVDHLVHWAHHGPEQARVDKVDISPGSGNFIRFEIIY